MLRSLGGSKFGIKFFGQSAFFSCGQWLKTAVLHGIIFVNMDIKAPLIVFCVVMGRSFSSICSSIAPFLLSYDTFGGLLGVSLVGMLPLCLSFGPTRVMHPPSLLLSMLLRLLAHPSFSSISG